MELQENLRLYNGVSGIRDDLSFGKEQLIFKLSAVGQALGLTPQALGNQIRASFEGELIQIFQDQGSEVEVRLRLSENERESLRSLQTLPIVLPNGGTSSLADLAELTFSRGFDDLKHQNGLLSVRVSADVDSDINNSNIIRDQVARDVMPELVKDFGIKWAYRGKAENQRESVGDIKIALPLSLVMIFIILAWVFRSYLWPLAVLSVIPFSLVGAFFGHWLLGADVTMLSLFGIFGLFGIVINDSIILIVVYQELRAKGTKAIEAAILAGERRLRAVLLTSMTTIIGIAPLLFESSKQAEFLKPMVISISFGLFFGTFIVLFLLPAVLVGIESIKLKFMAIKSDRTDLDIQNTNDVLSSANPHQYVSEDPLIVETLSSLKNTSNKGSAS
ncbi:efflux RND transporter permease subunit [Oceanicoccus sp. KOV_DT_Chl]|uniref:efflux RND transporter permease subunit n=1 Tax=Oceanicoccus sp. KOV_DT_Chl TaxID=1904639 RepID=UPI0021014DA8|nr:efflux RND transporter permease subunit [Oceanicoccus sp. KOV_DT_Chl]